MHLLLWTTVQEAGRAILTIEMVARVGSIRTSREKAARALYKRHSLKPFLACQNKNKYGTKESSVRFKKQQPSQ
jgi:hypothetical protein